MSAEPSITQMIAPAPREMLAPQPEFALSFVPVVSLEAGSLVTGSSSSSSSVSTASVVISSEVIKENVVTMPNWVKDVEKVDPLNMSPLEALNFLYELKRKMKE